MEAERQRYCPTFQIKYSMDILSLISSDAISFPPKEPGKKETTESRAELQKSDKAEHLNPA